MSFLKFLFVSTAVGAVAVTAPVVFVAGKMFGKIEERHQLSQKDGETAGKILFKHEAESTPWSGSRQEASIDEPSQIADPEETVGKPLG